MREFSRGETRIFRQQSAMAWAGKVVHRTATTITIANPYALRIGTPGMADLGGLTSVIITPEMIGQRIAIDVQIECKSRGKYPTPDQRHYLSVMQALGARSGVARSVEDAHRIILGLADR